MNVQDNLWLLKNQILEDNRFLDDFRLFRENGMEIEEDDYLLLSQVLEDFENNRIIEVYILTPAAPAISVNNQMVECKGLLVGKGPEMKILKLKPGPDNDVTLKPIPGKTLLESGKILLSWVSTKIRLS